MKDVRNDCLNLLDRILEKGQPSHLVLADYQVQAGETDAEAIILSPICAHVMGARSFVLDPGRRITVQAEKLHGRKAYLSVDGNWTMDLDNGDTMVVRRSEHYTLMANMGLKSFYDIAYQKLT